MVYANQIHLGSFKNDTEDTKMHIVHNLRDRFLKQYILVIVNALITSKIKTHFLTKTHTKTDPSKSIIQPIFICKNREQQSHKTTNYSAPS